MKLRLSNFWRKDFQFFAKFLSLEQCKSFRPGGPVKGRFSWFPHGIPEVQKCANLVNLIGSQKIPQNKYFVSLLLSRKKLADSASAGEIGPPGPSPGGRDSTRALRRLRYLARAALYEETGWRERQLLLLFFGTEEAYLFIRGDAFAIMGMHASMKMCS